MQPAIATESLPSPVASAARALPVQGWGTGLTASYFNNGSLAGAPVLKRQDAVIDFKWGVAAPAPELPVDNFSVRWEGLLAAPATGRYRFVAVTADEVRLWVNGKKVLDTWNGRKPTNLDDATVTLAAGEKTAIKLEYNDADGAAGIQLQWVPPGQAAQVIPSGNLYPLGSPMTPDPAGPPPVAKAKAVPTPNPAAAPAKTAAKPTAPTKPAVAEKAAKPAPKPVAQVPAKAAKPAPAEKAPKPVKPPKPAKEVAETPPPADLSGLYMLTVRSTGRPLKVDQGRPATRAEQLAAQAAGIKEEAQWRIEPAGEGLYRLVSPGSNKVLEVLGSSTSNGAPLSVWTYYSGYNQRWKIEDAGEGFYKLTPHHVRKKVLTYGDTLQGGLQQLKYSGATNQQWKLVPIKPVEEPILAGTPSTPGVGANNMSVYPNPSNGVMQMSYTLGEARPMGWVLYNQNGTAVRVSDYRKQPAGAHHQTLDFSGLPAGDYYLSLTVGATNTRQLISIRRPAADVPEVGATSGK